MSKQKIKKLKILDKKEKMGQNEIVGYEEMSKDKEQRQRNIVIK